MGEATLKGRTALVTGASGGIGEEIARQLAERGADLVLVARRQEKLEALAKEVSGKWGVKAEAHAFDLGHPQAPEALFDAMSGRSIDLLINNAGFGLYGKFTEVAWERTRDMLQLDVVALTELTHLFLKPMLERRWGRVMQIASIGAFQPCPNYAAYGAAKSYVLSFGEALNAELAGSGVSCTVVCPGFTATEFLQVAGQKENRFHRSTMMTAAQVARIGVKAMLDGKASVVTGAMNAVTAFMTRLVPRSAAAAMAGKVAGEE